MSKLHVVQQGQGPALVLSHALGCDLQMWDGVAQALQDRFTVVRYDHRGHGRSPAIGEAFDMNDLADDAAGVIEALGQGPVHFVGLSMGGMTAQALAARHPALVRSITVANSASYYDEAARAGWQARIATVRAQGVAAIADGAMQRWFTPEFRAGQAARVAALRRG
ncbi:alpha/beta fold hydrolase, partial [Delftia sp. ZNC0008]|uniref:alpha/beta fold hydrolase n=1 Tax=Delftia sp. ZNC0008 TaxID=1339242 RepID=UPI0006464F1D